MNENRFHFDARWSVEGFFPMPPYENKRASELLSMLIGRAVSASLSLHLLDHVLPCRPNKDLEEAAHEVLRTPFQMPCEGGEAPIQTIDRISLFEDAVHFSVNETYASYLRFADCCAGALRKAMACRIETANPLPLDEADRSLVVTALQALHRDRRTAWNCHAIYALVNAQCVQPREAFGLVQVERTLLKLGASTAP